MSKTKKLQKALKQKKLAHIKTHRKPELEEPPTLVQEPSEYFLINHQLKPPYNVLLDTNFINFSIKKKLDIQSELIRCLYAGVRIFVTDCVIGEIEGLGSVYRVALRIAKSFERVVCDHPGIYADDCLVNRVVSHRCYVVATCDTELKSRIRRVPGVPIVYVRGRRYDVEKLPRAVINKL